MDTTARSLVEFLDKAGEKGLLKRNTAISHSVAVKKVLGIEPGWEETDITQVDTDSLFTRFKNLHGLDYTPETLTEYERRFKRASKWFLNYLTNPAIWRHNGQSVNSKKGTTAKKASGTKNGNTSTPPRVESVELSTVTINSSGTQLVEYPFPLRESCIARLRLPVDLKANEVERLATFMRSVAVDFSK